MSFKKPQRNLYELDTIGAWQKCRLYGDVRFIESPSQNHEVFKSKYENHYLVKMRKENNGQCREKNSKKLRKVKRAGESDRTPFIDRTEYYNLSWWFV